MKKKEKLTWFSITAVIVMLVSVLVFAPGLYADASDRIIPKYLTLFEQVFRFVHENYVDEVDPKTLFEGALTGLFESLGDPHSTYLTQGEMEDLTDTTSGQFGGVGLYISKPEKPKAGEPLPSGYSPYIRVVAPIEDTPAAKAGIHAGDLIIEIEGEPTEEFSVDDAVDRLRGTPGTDVEVTIRRGKDVTLKVMITRAIIEVPTIKYDIIKEKIGYLRIIQFTPLTAEKSEEAIIEMRKKGIDSLIIDVRSNPGGLLSAVVDTADLFLDGGVIVSTRSRIESENAVFTAAPEISVPMSLPIVCIIDQGSASASEILAGALKDKKRGTLIGETTFGKGSVQQVKYIGAGGFKLTMSRYYTPSGVNIDKIGIEPDKKIAEPELSDEEWESYEALLQDQKISDFVKEKRQSGNAQVDEREINSFVQQLKKEGNILSERIIRRLVRNEINKTNDNPPIYDLNYDLVLQEAVKMIQTGELQP